jgi:mannose-1-phosphate guanylyltransferase
VPGRKKSRYIIQAVREKLRSESIRALILCGGKGARMRPLTLSIPKPMLPIGYRPILEHTMNCLKSQGIYDFVLAIGYLGEQIVKYFGDGSKFGINITYCAEERALGTGGAIKNAENLLSSTFITLNGDVVFGGLQIKDVLDYHRRMRATATLVLSHVADARRFGLVETDEEGRVTAFIEKPVRQTPGWINAGLYVFSPRIFRHIPAHRPISLEKKVFPGLVKQGDIFAYRHQGYWADLGEPRDYEKVCQDFFRGVIK